MDANLSFFSIDDWISHHIFYNTLKNLWFAQMRRLFNLSRLRDLHN